eukprot:TRINITY_DN25685_c0_g1_i1.p1 TRINITY_DN25685_c0_g1~~TRINITY_DN25685_c0_g1_i1.p1  ORF type:complete len:239 (+),score=19.34 TRINITY_DN25685_c0_g1_i1:39-719(+)
MGPIRARLVSIFTNVNKRNLRNDIATATGLGVVGDVLCQLGPEKRRIPSAGEWRWRLRGEEPHDAHWFDPRRCVATGVFGGIYIGFFLHFLYQCYPLVVFAAASRLPISATLRSGLMKEGSTVHAFGTALTDNCHNGLIYTPAFFLGVGVLQGDSIQDSIANLMGEWWSAYVGCTLFWLPFMWGNFKYVPTANRVQAMATANLLWNAIIDYISHRSLEESRVSISE